MNSPENHRAHDEHTRRVRSNLFTSLFANNELNLTDSEWRNTRLLTAGVIIGAIATVGVSIYNDRDVPGEDQGDSYIVPYDPETSHIIETE